MIDKQKILKLTANKPVAIFGAGVSGVAVKNLLNKIGVECVIYAENLNKCFTEKSVEEHKLVVYSPAFRPNHKWIEIAEKKHLECICETDLSALAWQGKIIAVTGTNGKTTLTSFLTHALNFVGKKAISVGNIGTPLSQICAEKDFDDATIAVYELSSFQTSRLKYLHPYAVLWTNFDSDHLDWHESLEEYFYAKVNLVKALTKEIFIAGSSVEKYANNFAYKLPSFTEILDEEKLQKAPAPFSSTIQAKNYAIAKGLWQKLSLDEKALEQACKSFELPQFRFSLPEKIGNIKFYNDSKATNAHAAIAAIKELAKEKNLIWLGGGKDKCCDLSELINCIAIHCKGAVVIGQTAEKLKELLEEKSINVKIAKDMAEAVENAYELALEDGCVVFSPAFSSFGMFAGYAERGKSFQNAVLCLKNSKKM